MHSTMIDASTIGRNEKMTFFAKRAFRSILNQEYGGRVTPCKAKSLRKVSMIVGSNPRIVLIRILCLLPLKWTCTTLYGYCRCICPKWANREDDPAERISEWNKSVPDIFHWQTSQTEKRGNTIEIKTVCPSKLSSKVRLSSMNSL